MVGIHVEVEAVVVDVFLRRDVALHLGDGDAGQRVVLCREHVTLDVAVEQDRVGTVAPVDMNVKVAQPPVVEGELGYVDKGVGLGLRE